LGDTHYFHSYLRMPGFHNRFYSMLCDSSMWILSDVLDNRWL